MRAGFLIAIGFFGVALAARADLAPSPGLSPSPSPSTVPENRAVRVVLHGGIVGFDQGAYQDFRGVAAGLLFNDVIGKFITEDYVLDGGGIFCLELSRSPQLTLAKLLGPLQAIAVDPAKTNYVMTPLEKCP